MRYPSDYDFQAISFIKQDATQTNRTFLVLGDAFSTAAALQVMGYRITNTTSGNVASIYLFEWGMSLPDSRDLNSFASLSDAVNRTKTDAIYLIISYRLGVNLQSTVSTCTSECGPPVFESERMYVFKYVPYGETNPFLVVDDNQTGTNFWSIERFGKGIYDISLNDDNISKMSQNDSMKIGITNGTYQRFTLSHIYDEPQDWSKKDLLVVWLNGNNSGLKYNIVFRTFTYNDYHIYQIADDFSVWKRLIIPLTSFTVVGSPSWSNVTAIMLQFTSVSQFTSLNLDRMVVDVRTP